MTQTFSHEFSITGPPEAARARLERVLTNRLRRPSGGGGGARNLHREMRLSEHTATSLTYKPKLVAPLPIRTAVWIGRLLGSERVKVTFAPGDGDGQTRITVSGKVGHGARPSPTASSGARRSPPATDGPQAHRRQLTDRRLTAGN